MQDFKYLGAWIDITWQDVKVRKGQAWSALNKMDKIWKSTLKRETKIGLFKATVEHVLLYGCETWTLTKKLNKSLDGCYTRMLRKALNISWKQHLTNKELYGELPPISNVIRKRRPLQGTPFDNSTNNLYPSLCSGSQTTGKGTKEVKRKHSLM